MDYTRLVRGNVLPAVGVLQKLLNRDGAKLVADGVFGHTTEQAVRAFQQAHRMQVSGAVGERTWRQVSVGENLQILDCVDVMDPQYLRRAARDIRRVGGHPMLIGGMCNGVEEVVTQILVAARLGTVFLLRFHGHGAAGAQGFSYGHGLLRKQLMYGQRADIDLYNFDEVQPVLRQLRPIFSAYGNVEFHGCHVGVGPQGEILLRSVADTLGVPATGGLQMQYFGGLSTFKFEGPTRTFGPNCMMLAEWCRTLPDFARMSAAA